MPSHAPACGAAFRRLLTLLCPAAALLAGCGRSAATDGAVTELASIRIFALEDTIFSVRSLFAADSLLWTLSSSSPFVHAVGLDGSVRTSMGRRGSGPGELLNPHALFVPEDGDDLVVWDAGRRTLVKLSQTGEPLGASEVEVRSGWVREDMRTVSYGEDNKLLPFGPGYVLQVDPHGLARTADYLRSRLVFVDSRGAGSDVLVDFDTLFRHHREDLGAATDLVPIPLWSVCGRDTLVVLDPFEETLLFFDGNGDRLAARDIRRPRRALSTTEIRGYVRHLLSEELRYANAEDTGDMDDVADAIARRERARFGQAAPPAVALLCDDRGRVWLNRFSLTDHPLGFSREWDVIGDEPLTVRFPGGFRPHAIRGATAFGVTTDDLDVERIARVDLRGR
jgi:hypothetical protein